MQKEKINRTEEQIEDIKKFIVSHGFKNMSDFSKAVGMERQNMSARIRGKCNPDIILLLKWAVILRCDIVELIELFYPEEYEYEGATEYSRIPQMEIALPNTNCVSSYIINVTKDFLEWLDMWFKTKYGIELTCNNDGTILWAKNFCE